VVTEIYGTVSAIHYRNEKLQIIVKNVVISDQDNSYVTQFHNRKLGAVCYAPEDMERPKIGANVAVHGTFHNFDKPRNPGQFDMALYYRQRGIDFSLSNAEVVKTSEGYSILGETLYQMRSASEKSFDRLFDEDKSSILKAMILGDKDYLSKETKTLFENSGCSHLLCISGTHIGIIGLALYYLLRRILRRKDAACVIASFVMFLYGLLSGMGSATLRAIIMFVMCLAADVLGRTYDVFTALAVAALVSLIINPVLIYDAGFLLSFGAVTGIALLKDMPASLAVVIFTFPLMLHFFYQYPLFSLFLGVFLIPLMGALLIGGILCIPVGLFFPLRILALPVDLLLEVYIRSCRAAVSVPGAVRVVGDPGVVRIAVYYLLMFGARYLAARWQRITGAARWKAAGNSGTDRWKAAGNSGTAGWKALGDIVVARWKYLGCIALLIFISVNPRRGMQLYMADVGQGDCLVMYDREACVLMDCGSSDESGVGEYRLIPMLKSLGISRVDAVLVSHTDEDHVSGIRELLEEGALEGIEVRQLFLGWNAAEDEAGQKILDLAKESGTTVSYVSRGDCLKAGGMSLRCLSPEMGQAGDKNELSLVMRLEYGNFSALLCGDVEGSGEEALIQELVREKNMGMITKVNIYKSAHHGSRGTNSAELLGLLKPEATLISCGVDNSYGHPHAEAISRIEEVGSNIFITKDIGAIGVWTDGNRIKVSGQIEE